MSKHKEKTICMLTYEVVDKGGNYLRCMSIAKSLSKAGWRVTILGSSKQATANWKQYQSQGIEVVEVPCILPFTLRHNGMSPFQVINRFFFLWRHSYSVVYGFGHRPAVSIPVLTYKWLTKKPVFGDWADLWSRDGIGSLRKGTNGWLVAISDEVLEKFFFSHVDQLSVISTYLLKLAKIIRPQKETFLVPVGLDQSDLSLPAKALTREKLGFGKKEKICLFLGNADYDAKFLKEVSTYFHLERYQVRLVCVGNVSEVFLSMSKKFKGQTKLVLTGFVDHQDVVNYLAAADVALLPYLYKKINLGRFPNKLSDYATAGKPIITNATGDMILYLKRAKSGLLANDEPRIFYLYLKALLSSPSLQKYLSKNASRMSGSVTWDIVTQELVKRLQLTVGNVRT